MLLIVPLSFSGAFGFWCQIGGKYTAIMPIPKWLIKLSDSRI